MEEKETRGRGGTARVVAVLAAVAAIAAIPVSGALAGSSGDGGGSSGSEVQQQRPAPDGAPGDRDGGPDRERDCPEKRDGGSSNQGTSLSI
jgi:hypothetical protein